MIKGVRIFLVINMTGSIEDLIKIYNAENLGSEFNPNPQQLEAIKHIDGPLFLVAVPGSGKTTVLIWRTANLIIYHNIKPENILLTTFTKKAAKQLKNKLTDLLKLASKSYGIEFDIAGMAIGTIHSICKGGLDDFAKKNKKDTKILLDSFNQFLFIKKSCKEEDGKIVRIFDEDIQDKESKSKILKHSSTFNISFKRKIAKALVNIFNRISEEGNDLSGLSQECKKEYNLFINLYENYREALEREQLTDYSLLQKDYFELISHFESYCDKFKYLIVDEYQDTNTIQEKIYFHLAKNSGNLCVVGDDDQSLYRFRGATVENFINFEERFLRFSGKKAKRIDLDINYRSWSGIVNFYDRYIQGQTRKEQKPTENFSQYRVPNKKISASRQGDGNKSLLFIKSDEDDCAEQIAKLISDLQDRGYINKCSDCAFIFPSIRVGRAKSICETLSRDYNIKLYNPILDTVFEEDGSLKSIGAIVKVLGIPIADPRGQQKDYLKYLEKAESYFENNINREDKEEIIKFLRDGMASSMSINAFLYGLNTKFSINNDKLRKIFLDNSKARINNWDMPIPCSQNDKIESYKHNLLRSFLYDAFFYYENQDDEEIELGTDIFPFDKFPVITIHAAKGLEFSIVILLDLPERQKRGNDSNIENERFARLVKGSENGLEPLERIIKFDELRKYYVAFSRAKNLLVIAGDESDFADEIQWALSSFNAHHNNDNHNKELTFLFQKGKE